MGLKLHQYLWTHDLQVFGLKGSAVMLTSIQSARAVTEVNLSIIRVI